MLNVASRSCLMMFDISCRNCFCISRCCRRNVSCDLLSSVISWFCPLLMLVSTSKGVGSGGILNVSSASSVAAARNRSQLDALLDSSLSLSTGFNVAFGDILTIFDGSMVSSGMAVLTLSGFAVRFFCIRSSSISKCRGWMRTFLIPSLTSR